MNNAIIFPKEVSARQKFRTRLINWFIIPVFGGMLVGYLTCDEDFSDFWSASIISATFWLVLSEGNGYMATLVDKQVTWLENPIKRFIIGIVVLMIYTTLASLIILYIYLELYYDADFFKYMNRGWIENLKIPMMITLFIALLLHSKEFLMSWRQVAINNEKLISENLASQYESLKSQVNPHFLFNSLNALSSLVYSNQDKAVQFIRKLSEVYRYVLDHQMDEVVSLKDEIEFVESFVFLNKIRFGENLRVNIVGFDGLKEGDMIPPLAIQMLLENCFKHNVVSKADNLEVEISLENDHVVVKNNLNPKKVMEDSSGLGLNNIISRYKFLTEKPVEVNQDETHFIVKIPLIKSVK